MEQCNHNFHIVFVKENQKSFYFSDLLKKMSKSIRLLYPGSRITMIYKTKWKVIANIYKLRCQFLLNF